jgi:hypothetical protein
MRTRSPRSPLHFVVRSAALASLLLLLASCGSKSGLRGIDPIDAGMDAPELDAFRFDAPPDVGNDVGTDAFTFDAGTDAPFDAGCMPVNDRCGGLEVCGNGLDDNCNGSVDETCGCEIGSVQSCFTGPPGRRGIGACSDGEQTCESSPDGRGRWGDCTGGTGPAPDVCNGLDNLCNGCSFDRDCPISCPGPDDPRILPGTPFEPYPLRVRDFYPGRIARVNWRIEGGPCDRLATRLVSFELSGADSEIATFTPRLSGDYRITLTVVTAEGTTLTCEWIVHVEGPGLRIEMCYPESETQDLDLLLSQPGFRVPWYLAGGNAFNPTPRACSWFNCQAALRGATARADWGYPNSPLVECENGPQGDQWRALGFCPNPRLDIDNNLDMSVGLPENINIDAPRDDQTFRIMVHNFTGAVSRPVVNVYCAGRRIATYGADPDPVVGYMGPNGNESIGAMWRVADVTTFVDAAGVLRCESTVLHPPGLDVGYDVSVDDNRF